MDLGTELCVRVKEDQDRDFIARLKADSEKLYRVGNVFIADVRSFTDIRLTSAVTYEWPGISLPFRNGFLVVEYILGIARYFLVPYSATTW